MGFRSKRELLVQIVVRYREAGRKEKTIMLNEFVAVTGYARKYAVRLLGQPVAPVVQPLRRPRKPHYGPEVQAALVTVWTIANGICAKRLVPFLPELVQALEDHGHLCLTPAVRAELLAISPATADRLLAGVRQGNRPRGLTTTKPGALLKRQVPVRTFADWNQVQPGFFEADLVAHCGTSMAGSYLWSLVLTDVATGWTECVALRHRSQDAVIAALGRVRQLLPFPLLGLDTDNGGEFLNRELIEYCEREQITFTRGRAYKKNDQCFVEQKNGSIVRQLVGYDRFDGEVAYRQLVELYRAARLYVNFFQPSMKLQAKQRDGGRVQRRYDAARTPYQRLAAAGILTTDGAEQLANIFRALDPLRLLGQLRAIQDALWRHAQLTIAGPVVDSGTAGARHVQFDLAGCLGGKQALAAGNELNLTAAPATSSEEAHKRKYRRTKKPVGPRYWRTRADPFASIENDLRQALLAAPGRTAKSLFQEVQERFPGQYPDRLLRTLQRRVKIWRQQVIIEFDDTLLHDSSLLQGASPTVLRAIWAETSDEWESTQEGTK